MEDRVSFLEQQVRSIRQYMPIEELTGPTKGYKSNEDQVYKQCRLLCRDIFDETKNYIDQTCQALIIENIERSEHQLNNQIILLRRKIEEIDDINTKLVTMSSQIKDRANLDDFLTLKRDVYDKYITIYQFRDLENTVAKCAKWEDLNTTKKDAETMKEAFDSLEKEYREHCMVADNFTDSFKKMIDKMGDQIDKNTGHQNQQVVDVSKRIEANKQNQHNINMSFKQRFEEQDRKMSQFCSSKEMRDIKVMAEGAVSKWHIEDLRAQVVPRVKGFQEEIMKFRDENLDMRTIIRRFDEDMCTKANKQRIIEFEAQVQSLYLKRSDLETIIEKNEEQAKKREAEAEKLKEDLLKFDERVNNEFTKLCIDTIEDRLEQYSTVYKNFTQFFNMEDLQDWFKKKSDVTDIKKLASSKASKDDVWQVHRLIDEVYSRIKHLSILQTEIAKSMVPQKPSSSFTAAENVNTKLMRRDFLAKQSEITQQWITDIPLRERLPVSPRKAVSHDVTARGGSVKKRTVPGSQRMSKERKRRGSDSSKEGMTDLNNSSLNFNLSIKNKRDRSSVQKEDQATGDDQKPKTFYQVRMDPKTSSRLNETTPVSEIDDFYRHFENSVRNYQNSSYIQNSHGLMPGPLPETFIRPLQYSRPGTQQCSGPQEKLQQSHYGALNPPGTAEDPNLQHDPSYQSAQFGTVSNGWLIQSAGLMCLDQSKSQNLLTKLASQQPQQTQAVYQLQPVDGDKSPQSGYPQELLPLDGVNNMTTVFGIPPQTEIQSQQNSSGMGIINQTQNPIKGGKSLKKGGSFMDKQKNFQTQNVNMASITANESVRGSQMSQPQPQKRYHMNKSQAKLGSMKSQGLKAIKIMRERSSVNSMREDPNYAGHAQRFSQGGIQTGKSAAMVTRPSKLSSNNPVSTLQPHGDPTPDPHESAYQLGTQFGTQQMNSRGQEEAQYMNSMRSLQTSDQQFPILWANISHKNHNVEESEGVYPPIEANVAANPPAVRRKQAVSSNNSPAISKNLSSKRTSTSFGQTREALRRVQTKNKQIILSKQSAVGQQEDQRASAPKVEYSNIQCVGMGAQALAQHHPQARDIVNRSASLGKTTDGTNRDLTHNEFDFVLKMGDVAKMRAGVADRNLVQPATGGGNDPYKSQLREGNSTVGASTQNPQEVPPSHQDTTSFQNQPQPLKLSVNERLKTRSQEKGEADEGTPQLINLVTREQGAHLVKGSGGKKKERAKKAADPRNLLEVSTHQSQSTSQQSAFNHSRVEPKLQKRYDEEAAIQRIDEQHDLESTKSLRLFQQQSTLLQKDKAKSPLVPETPTIENFISKRVSDQEEESKEGGSDQLNRSKIVFDSHRSSLNHAQGDETPLLEAATPLPPKTLGATPIEIHPDVDIVEGGPSMLALQPSSSHRASTGAGKRKTIFHVEKSES